MAFKVGDSVRVVTPAMEVLEVYDTGALRCRRADGHESFLRAEFCEGAPLDPKVEAAVEFAEGAQLVADLDLIDVLLDLVRDVRLGRFVSQGRLEAADAMARARKGGR